jgi:hypothetical protein
MAKRRTRLASRGYPDHLACPCRNQILSRLTIAAAPGLHWLMRSHLMIAAACAAAPSAAFAQQFPFERSFDVAGSSKIDITTVRGKIEIVAGEPGRIVVGGAATVRVGWNVPVNAVELARQVAAAPPVERLGDTIRMRPPAGDAAQRAVTVSYRVQVPPNTEARAISDSGATSVRGVAAAVDVRTQSAAIDLDSLGGVVNVSTGSGAIVVADVAGALTASTGSSSFTASGVGSSLRVRTQSGAIDATLTGNGDVDVESGSGAIRVRGVRGGLTARSQSGRIRVEGAPGREWLTTTGSSGVDLSLERGSGFSIDAATRSGSVVVEGRNVQGSVAEREVSGTVGGGGPVVRIRSGSGSVRVHIASQ